jgi:hypothetical protein
MRKVNFYKISSELEIFNKLPSDLHGYIYGFISYDVINSIFYKYNWYEIFEYIGYSYSYEHLIEKLNYLLPNKTDKFQITNSDMYSVGFYEEKVKASIWGRRYIWYEDCINEENTINLIIDKIDDYITSKHYNEEVLFKINKKISLLLKEIIQDEELKEDDPYIIGLSNEMIRIVNFIE